MNINPVPRVAAIHDMSGFGRTSLTVAIPVLSSMGIQACPLPTAILSTHTVEYTDFTLLDLTDEMGRILNHWERLGLHFEAVYSGFMASAAQMDHVARCIQNCMAPGGLAVVDPVLGDNGVLDPTMTPEMVNRMRWLVSHADVITPNFTEAAFLLDEPCRQRIDEATLCDWLGRLCAMGPARAVITSVPLDSHSPHSLSVAALDSSRAEGAFWRVDAHCLPAHYPGTGDAFASVLTGALLQGDSLPVAVDRAAQFATLCIQSSFGYGLPTREGVLLERMLPSLRVPMTQSSYQQLDATQKPDPCEGNANV